jgi:hypothetical protein
MSERQARVGAEFSGARGSGSTGLPVWPQVIAALAAVLLATGAAIALFNLGVLVGPHEQINEAARVYAGYLASRNFALAEFLLGALVSRSKSLLNHDGFDPTGGRGNRLFRCSLGGDTWSNRSGSAVLRSRGRNFAVSLLASEGVGPSYAVTVTLVISVSMKVNLSIGPSRTFRTSGGRKQAMQTPPRSRTLG